jgi:hypothetical protein
MAGFDPLQTLALPDIMRPWSDGGAVMALDEKLRRQLIEARGNICAQLEQLEGAAVDPYDGGIAPGRMPDSRKVYAELQGELNEIDTLLEADGKDMDVEAKSAYQPMVKWYGDGTVGNPVRPTKAGITLGIIGVGSFVVVLVLALLRAIASE